MRVARPPVASRQQTQRSGSASKMILLFASPLLITEAVLTYALSHGSEKVTWDECQMDQEIFERTETDGVKNKSRATHRWVILPLDTGL